MEYFEQTSKHNPPCHSGISPTAGSFGVSAKLQTGSEQLSGKVQKEGSEVSGIRFRGSPDLWSGSVGHEVAIKGQINSETSTTWLPQTRCQVPPGYLKRVVKYRLATSNTSQVPPGCLKHVPSTTWLPQTHCQVPPGYLKNVVKYRLATSNTFQVPPGYLKHVVKYRVATSNTSQVPPGCLKHVSSTTWLPQTRLKYHLATSNTSQVPPGCLKHVVK